MTDALKCLFMRHKQLQVSTWSAAWKIRITELAIDSMTPADLVKQDEAYMKVQFTKCL